MIHLRGGEGGGGTGLHKRKKSLPTKLIYRVLTFSLSVLIIRIVWHEKNIDNQSKL